MGERTSHQDASLSHTSSQQRSNVAVELPPPYTERESPIAALTRRIGRPPNATAESANVADSHRSSRRSLDQRTKQSRTLVVRLGCALLLIGLLVSCTAFVLALVSFSASDTQHLQQQLDALRDKFEALQTSNGELSTTQLIGQEVKEALQPLEQQISGDATKVRELSRSYDFVGLGLNRINESLTRLRLSSADQETWFNKCVGKVTNVERQVERKMERIEALETENKGLKDMVQRMSGEIERYRTSVATQLTAFSLKLPVDCSMTCSFVPFQSIITDGAYDIEPFMIDRQYYLAVANYGDISTGRHTTDSMIYRFTGHSFEVYQRLRTQGAYDVKPFNINHRHFLAIANHGDGETYNTKSLIYEWNSTHFAPFQFILTHQACDIEAFEINGQHFVAIANRFNGETYNVDVSVLVWDGSSNRFMSFQSLEASGASGIEHFTVDDDDFLAIASYKSGPGQYLVSSRIYRWHNGEFVLHQDVLTVGAWDVRAIQVKKRHYLMFSCYYNGHTRKMNSLLLKWDEKQRVFVNYEQVKTHGVRNIDYITVNGRHLLFAASYRLGNNFNVESTMFEWVNRTFVVKQTFSTKGSMALKPLELGTNVFLAAMQSFDGSKSTIASEIYRYQ